MSFEMERKSWVNFISITSTFPLKHTELKNIQFSIVTKMMGLTMRLILVCLVLSSREYVRAAVPTIPKPWYIVSSGTKTWDLSKLPIPKLPKSPFMPKEVLPPTPVKKTSPLFFETTALTGLWMSEVNRTAPVLVTNCVVFLAWKTSLILSKLDFHAFSLVVIAGNMLWNHREPLKVQRELCQLKNFLRKKLLHVRKSWEKHHQEMLASQENE